MMASERNRASSSSGTADALQAQLVALSMNIEDRIRASDLLRGAIDTEHSKYDRLSNEMEYQYAKRSQKHKEDQSQELAQQVAGISRLIQEKQTFSTTCRRLLEDVRSEEEETQRLVDQLRRENDEELQQAYATWGQGEVTRRERWVARKAEEIRERTVKGLEPEIQRLVEQHKLDCLEIETQFKEEERMLKKQIGGGANASLEAAQQRCRRHLVHAQEAEREDFATKVNKLVENHHQQLQKVHSRLSAEKEAHRQSHMEEVKRHQETHAHDISRLQALHQERLKSLRDKLQQEKETLQRHHKDALTAQAEQATVEQEEWESHICEKVEEDRELHLEKERIRLGRMRDAEIEKTIHVMQTENLLFEKKCSKRFEEGLIRAKVELEEKKNIIQKESDDAALGHEEEVARQHRASKGLVRAREILREKGAMVRHIENEMKKLKKQLENQNVQCRNDQEDIVLREKSVRSDAQRRKEEMAAVMTKSQKQLEAIEEEKERRRKDINLDHENILRGLHLEVKEKVEDVDKEVACLRDAIITEKTKRSQFDKLLEKYDPQEIE